MSSPGASLLSNATLSAHASPPTVLTPAQVKSRSVHLKVHPFLLTSGDPKIIYQACNSNPNSAELFSEGANTSEDDGGVPLGEAPQRNDLASTPAVTQMLWFNENGDGETS